MKHARPYRLYFRKDTGFFYYRLPSEGRWRSTGQTKEPAAHRFVIEEVLPALEQPPEPEPTITFKQYLDKQLLDVAETLNVAILEV